MLRTWNARRKQWQWTPAGIDYYKHNRQRFVVNVPCLGYIPEYKTRNGQGSLELVRSTVYGKYQSWRDIPMQQSTIEEFVEIFPGAYSLVDMQILHDGINQAEVETKLKHLVSEFLSKAPVVQTADGPKHKIAVESTLIWVWDPTREITFDEQIVEGDEHPHTEILMDRPLRGDPCIDDRMYGRQGLCKIACLDLTDQGGCVVAQIAETVKHKIRREIKTTEPNAKRMRVREEQPRFKPEEVAKEFDIIFEDFADKPPYTTEGKSWRDIGVTSSMCARFCEKHDIGLRVLYKNAIIYKNIVAHERPVIVYQIWGNHAFFLDQATVKNGACHLHEAAPLAEVKDTVVRLRGRANTVVPFSDMHEFDEKAFRTAVDLDESATFYCYPTEVKDIQAKISDIPVWAALGNRPETIRSLNVCEKSKRDKTSIKVKVVAPNALQLQEFCQVFCERNNWRRLIYAGESHSVVFAQAMNLLFTSRRMSPPEAIKQHIKNLQKNRCALCGDELSECEFDHTTPLCLGGTNEPENIRALCGQCHAEETNRLARAGIASTTHTIESQCSPQMWRQLHHSPKPKEVTFGTFQEFPEKHVGDLLTGHVYPETARRRGYIPSGVDHVWCMDAKSCRLFAITKRTRGLPVFSPMDEWEPFEARPLEEWDFVYIDIGCRVHPDVFPWTGDRWYAAEIAEYLLDNGIISLEHCKAGLCATRHIPSSALAQHVETIRDTCEHMNFGTTFGSEREMERFIKQGLLSMIGLWNCQTQHAFRVVRSTHQIDAGPGVRSRKQLEDGTFEWTACDDIVDCFSMAPWGRISLDIEQLRIAQAMGTLRNLPDAQILGAHVDGVMFIWKGFGPLPSLDMHKFPDGTPMFHLKREPVCKVPQWEQPDPVRSQGLQFIKHEWRVIYENELQDYAHLAKLVKEHSGILITGAAGTGKSYPLRRLLPELAKLFPGKRQLSMALRHAAAMIIGGKTIAHYMHKYRGKNGAPSAGTVVVLDEVSELTVQTWAELSRWKMMGVIFILIGDCEGQRKCIFDPWDDSTKDVRQSQLLWEFAGGIRVEMTEYRRGDEIERQRPNNLFKAYTALYPFADDESHIPRAVSMGLQRYPWRNNIECYFVLSHEKRIMLNRYMNYEFAKRKIQQGCKVLFLPCPGNQLCVTMQPQAMIIWTGMELMCYSRKHRKNLPTTGAVYVVQSWDEHTVTVKLHDDYICEAVCANPNESTGSVDPDGAEDNASVEFTMSHTKASDVLRLQFAHAYAAVQGRTFRYPIGLMDLAHAHITMRDIITAISRPTNSEYLHFVHPAKQFEIERKCTMTDDDMRDLTA